MGLISNSNLTSTYQPPGMNSLTDNGPSLQQGSNDTIEVLKLQKNLESLGYSTEGENGYFGANTQSALKAFQKDFGLLTTGIADNQTLSKLREVSSNDTQAVASDSFIKTPILVSGSQGQAVGDLQMSLKRLGYFSPSVDSYFGVSTEDAVKALQMNNGLQDTGIVDMDTKMAISRGLSNLNITPSSYSSYASYRNITYKEASISQGSAGITYSFGFIEDGSISINNSSSSVSDYGGGAGSSSEVDRWKSAWDSNQGYIQKGNNNDSVKYMQYMLTKLGFLNDVVDGIFGNNTLNAVKSFQNSKGLQADGIVGPKTKESLNSVFAQSFGTSTSTPPVTSANPGTDFTAEEAKWKSAWDSAGTLSYGSKGDAVKFLQLILTRAHALSDAIDGDFGEKTLEAVKRFQDVHMLASDGVVGANTRKTIDVMYANKDTTTMTTTLPGVGNAGPTSEQEAQWKRAWDASGTLSVGSKGDAVKFLQLMLTRTYAFNGLIDGDFGDITRQGLERFQDTHCLKVDGIAGNQTKDSINLIYANRDTTVMTIVLPGTTVSPEQEAKWKSAWDAGATLSEGSTGDAVRYLQLMLRKVHPFNGAVDGIFGDETYNAVCGYQNTHLLQVDGIVGSQTRSSINKVYADSKIPVTTPSVPTIPPTPTGTELENLKAKIVKAANVIQGNILNINDSFDKSVDIFLELLQDKQKGHYFKGTYTFLNDKFKPVTLNHWANMVISGHAEDSAYFARNLMPDVYYDFIPPKAPTQYLENGAWKDITCDNKYDNKTAKEFYKNYYYALDLFHEVNYKIAIAGKTNSTTVTAPQVITPPTQVNPPVISTNPGTTGIRTGIPVLKPGTPTIGTSTPSVMPRIGTSEIDLARPRTVSDDIDSTSVALEGINPGRVALKAYQTNTTLSAAEGIFDSHYRAYALIVYGPDKYEGLVQSGLGLGMGLLAGLSQDTVLAIEGIYDFCKNGNVKDLPQYGKALFELLGTAEGQESLGRMVAHSIKAWEKAYGEADYFDKGRMVGQLIGQIISTVTGAVALSKGIKEAVKGVKLLASLDSFADFVSLARKTLKSTPERIFENIKSVFRNGDELKIVDCGGQEMILNRTELRAALKADGMADDAIESAVSFLEEGCFAGDTLVSTKEGSRRIDEIQIGDYVLAKNVNTGELTYKQVQQVYIKSADKFIRLNIGDETIRTTPSHLFFTDSGWWKAADNIKDGDKILLSNGELKEVHSAKLEELEEHERIYNINVEEYHTYFVGGQELLVHNDCSVAKVALTAKRVAENKNFSEYQDRIRYSPRDQSTHGKWVAPEGEEAIRGESTFISTNSEVNAILKEHGLDGIKYTDGKPDFSKVVATKNGIRAEFEIDNMSVTRSANFKEADTILAEKWGMSYKEVVQWRETNKYTWHELNDTRTIQLIPTSVNGEFNHIGGVGELRCKFKLGGDLGE